MGDDSRSTLAANRRSPPAAGDGRPFDPHGVLPSPRALWFAFLGAPVAWAANLIIGYSIQATVCNAAGPGTTVLGVPAGNALPELFSVLAAAVAVAGVVIAWKEWRATGTGEENPEATVPPELGRSWFMAYGGLVSSALFLLAILLTGVVELALAPCAGL